MELGDLELALVRTLREMGEASPREIYKEVRRSRGVAYTSVTTTLYRLVDKDLVAVRREGEKRAFYRLKEGGTLRRMRASMVDRLVDAFGGAAVSHLLENPEERARLGSRGRKRGRKHG
ncbi:MAG TPA: BlaI/MecI/CopY family transcriptional regulator [Thermoplasmata archaeon]|nr:BlaI/MecI/CopY family transcriptional regulator [Thermoplasmata archaeon]